MKVKREAAKVVGTLQGGLGLAIIILSLLLQFNVFNFQEKLGIPPEHSMLLLLTSWIFGVISLISSVFLILD